MFYQVQSKENTMTQTNATPTVSAALIVNLTPHGITLLDQATKVTFGENDKFKSTPLANLEDLIVLRELPIDGLARVGKKVVDSTEIDGILTEMAEFSAINGLPDPVDGTFFVVSALIVSAAVSQGRSTSDLLTPGTTVRNSSNPSQVLGTFKLQRN